MTGSRQAAFFFPGASTREDCKEGSRSGYQFYSVIAKPVRTLAVAIRVPRLPHPPSQRTPVLTKREPNSVGRVLKATRRGVGEARARARAERFTPYEEQATLSR